jgi:hypothetical protein
MYKKPDLTKYSYGLLPIFVHLAMDDDHFGYKQKFLQERHWFKLTLVRPIPIKIKRE